MRKLFSLFLPICLLIIFTSGCAHSVAKLKRDDNLRHEVLKDCLAMGINAKDDLNCKNATKAQAEVAGDSIKGMFK